jgi:hypothetical protein
MENQNNNTNATHTRDKADGRLLTGMFKDRESVDNAYNSFHERGYSQDDINVFMSDDTRKKHFADEDTEIGTKAAEGLGKGSAIGGTIGAVAGIIAALGTSVVIPGLGLAVAGPIVAGLAGAGAGGFTGGVIGALVGSGIPEERARIYEEGIKNGNIVMGVKTRNDEDAEYFRNNWQQNRGEEIHH